MVANKPTDKTEKKQLTTVEIAQMAGVSQSTVSRVLNDNPSVDPEKRAAVLKVIEELNFRPNFAAKGLVSGRSYSVGVMTRYLGSPFFTEVLRGVATGLKGSKYSPIIALGSDVVKEDMAALDLLLERRPDALILQLGWQIPDEYVRKLAEETPLVIIGRHIEGLEDHCVTVNNYDAAYRATAFLISRGHTLIAHISGSSTVMDAVERRRGYTQALIDHGLEVNPELIVEGDLTEASGAMSVKTLLSRRAANPFSAIFVANDQMATSVRLALYHHGIDVPEDISLVGFDDQPGSQYMIPPLTTIRQPAYQMGVIAAQAMLAVLAGKTLQLPEFPLELVVRESVSIR